MKVKIKAELDDEAFKTGEFIQELSRFKTSIWISL